MCVGFYFFFSWMDDRKYLIYTRSAEGSDAVRPSTRPFHLHHHQDPTVGAWGGSNRLLSFHQTVDMDRPSTSLSGTLSA